MLLVHVKDSKGDIWEVTPQNATDLVQQHGWTRVGQKMQDHAVEKNIKNKIEQAKEEKPKEEKPKKEKTNKAIRDSLSQYEK